MKKVNVSAPQSGWGTVRTKYPPHSIMVRADDLTAGTKNCDSSVAGSLTKRKGITPAFVPNNLTRDQYEAIFSDGVRHLLLVGGGTLEFAAGTSGSTVVTTGYSTLSNFEFGLYNDRVYFDNGLDSPQVYDRQTTYGGVVYTAPRAKVMGAQAPGSAPTFGADTAGGNVPAGAHTYKVTFLYYGSEESNGGPATAVHTVANPNNTVNLTAVPIGGYGVTARKIYRDNNDGAWLLVGQINDNTTTTFQDTAAVGTAVIPTDNGVPPSFRFIEIHLDRAWIAGIPGDPTGLRFSAAGEPDIFPAANRIGCNPEDPIAAIFVFNGRVFVFNQNSVGEILGQTSDTFYYSPLSPTVGCADTRSIRVRVVDGVPQMVWLSNKGPYMTNGWVIQYIGDPIEDQITLNIQQTAVVRGQDAEATEEAFSEGTSSPAIDLDVVPNAVTVENPKRIWQAEPDWVGGSSLTNVVTEDGTNTISVPTAFTPTIGQGTLSGNAQNDGSGGVNLPSGANDAGGSSLNQYFLVTASSGYKRSAERIFFPRGGTITSASVGTQLGTTPNFRVSAHLQIWTDVAGLPNVVLFQGPRHDRPGTGMGRINITEAVSIPVAAGTYLWIGAQFGFDEDSSGNDGVDPNIGGAREILGQYGFFGTSVNTNFFFFPAGTTTGTVLTKRDTLGTPFAPWGSQQFSGPNNVQSSEIAYVYSQTPVASSGQWRSPVIDTQILAGPSSGITVDITGTYPSPSIGHLVVESSDDPLFGSIATTDTFVNPSGTDLAVTGFGHRYWRMTLQLSTTDDRFVPDMGMPTIEWNQTSIWVSEVIDHTTDITSLDTLTIIDTVPSGTSVVLEIATSANNIAYTAFGPIGSAVVQRYSKIRVTMTATTDGSVTPTVTSVTFTWSVVANLVSRVIDTGTQNASWDVFQATFTKPVGSDLHLFMKSAATVPGLAGATYFEVFNGQFPGVPVNRYAQWKVIITAHADEVPVLSSVTVSWLIAGTNAPRVASLFFSRSYYLAAAEFGSTLNNIIFVLDWEGKWRIHRDISVATMSLFFNAPYAGLADQAYIVKMLDSTGVDLPLPIIGGNAIQMVVRTKAFDFGDVEHLKICRKVYIRATTTQGMHSTWTVAVSFDNGNSFINMVDPLTGSLDWIMPDANGTYIRRFVLPFNLGQQTAGRTILLDIREATLAPAELDAVKIEAWVRSGEPVTP